MDQYRGVGVLEEPRAYEKRAADELLLGGPEGNRNRARQPVALHHLLHRVGRSDCDSTVRVVTLHVPGCPLDERFAGDAPGCLRALGQGVDLGDDYDLGLAAAPLRPDVGGHSGAAGLDLESDSLERFLQEFRALELLHTQFGEVIERVADDGELLGVALDDLEGELFPLVDLSAARECEKEAEYSEEDRG